MGGGHEDGETGGSSARVRFGGGRAPAFTCVGGLAQPRHALYLQRARSAEAAPENGHRVQPCFCPALCFHALVEDVRVSAHRVVVAPSNLPILATRLSTVIPKRERPTRPWSLCVPAVCRASFNLFRRSASSARSSSSLPSKGCDGQAF